MQSVSKKVFLLPSFDSAGKGTFATRLAPHFGIPTISTGDLIRAEIKNNTTIGQQVKAASEKGALIGDEIVNQLLRTRLSAPDCTKGFILDGYPRRVSQADALSEHFHLDLVVDIALQEDVLVTKACARRVCENCGTGYNIANIQSGRVNMTPLLPKVEGKCDKCGGKLIQRADDTEATVRRRLQAYHEETKPIVDYYRQKGLLVTFDVYTGLSDLPDLIKTIEMELIQRRGAKTVEQAKQSSTA